MSDDLTAGQLSQPPALAPTAELTAAAPVCPWCSVALQEPAPERCPSCGARLVEDPNTSIPGVTTLDPALLRIAQAATPPAPRRSFLRGILDPVSETDASGLGPASADALAPPSRAVVAEMRRLRAELDAAAAADASAADASAGGTPEEDLARGA